MYNQKKNILFFFISLFLVQCQSPPKNINNKITDSISPIIIASAARIDHKSAEASGSKYAVATQGIYATIAAKEIFKLGGNAIDAAIAASFTLAVERPHSTGIGGGGFMLFREGKTKKIFAIDFRERAPLKSSENMFVGLDGKVVHNLSLDGVLASAVPGLVAGLLEIHQRFGRLTRKSILKPAISLARNGFPIYPSLAGALIQKEEVLSHDPEARKIFLDNKMKAFPEGHILKQIDLAHTLERISKLGRAGFYQGEVAKEYIALNKKGKGLLVKNDLSSYHVKWRTPLKGDYKGFEIYSMPPPSSGGVHVIQFLNMLELDSLHDVGLLSTRSIHLAASSLQAAFADRAQYLGDPDFTKVPVASLISKEYAQMRRNEFSIDHARKSSDVKAGDVTRFEHTETTHLSIMDDEGNAVATTQTINGYMGASIVVPHTGIVLNNEMDDFTALVGASNLFGAIGGKANSIVPGKTPLSSMSPTIIVRDGSPVLSLGAPGGTRIISCVAQTILNYLEFKIPLYESVATIRYHHQWLPDVLDIDPPGPRKEVLKELIKLGYNVQLRPVPCNVMAVSKEKNNNTFHAVADPRDIGTSTAL
ncbi:MAG: gamma-glutamyltransferase [Bacteriovorax sp.]|nr:gamma-glutamyltransferase [Bacteriovorax sp.]